MSSIKCLILLCNLCRGFSGHIGGNTGTFKSLCEFGGFSAHGNDTGNMAGSLGGNHLVHKSCALSETQHLEVAATGLVEHSHKDVKVFL